MFLPTVPGLIVTAIGTVTAVFSSIFGNFSFWSDMAEFLNSAAQGISEIGAYISQTGVWSIVVNWLAVDTFIRVSLFVLVGTVGLTVAVTITLFISIVTLLPVTLAIRALMRTISVASGGFIDP